MLEDLWEFHFSFLLMNQRWG